MSLLEIQDLKVHFHTEDGVVKALNIEAPGKFEVSGAEPMLKQLG